MKSSSQREARNTAFLFTEQRSRIREEYMSKLQLVLFSILFLGNFALTTGCTSKGGSGTATVTLQLPSTSSSSSSPKKLAAKNSVSSLSFDPLAYCYAATVSSSDIPTASAGVCDPAYGKISGSIPMGGSLDLEVTLGMKRKLSIFAIKNVPGSPCPDVHAGFGAIPRGQIYSLGSQTIDVQSEAVDVAINIELPSAKNVVADLYSLPMSCYSPLLSNVATGMTVAGQPKFVVDSKNNVIVPDTNNSKVWKVDSNGVLAVFAGNGVDGNVDGTGTAAEFSRPFTTAIDSNDNTYVADYGTYSIRKITPAGVVSTYVTGFGEMSAFAVGDDGSVYVLVSSSWVSTNTIVKIDPNGVGTVFAGGSTPGNANGNGAAARFNNLTDVTIDSAGNLFVIDAGNFSIRKITPNGDVTTFAGSGTQGIKDGQGTSASFGFYQKGFITSDGAGNLYVTDVAAAWAGSYIRRITPSGLVTTFCGAASQAYNQEGLCTNSSIYPNTGFYVGANSTLFLGLGGVLQKISW
jgi:hypothetical protein